jgi:ketosteroid isomerase-like protein
MTDPKYAAFTALDPFFQIVQQGLAGLVDGDHYFETIADDAVFEFRYDFPGWPRMVSGRDTLMNLYSGYGDNIVLHGADALVVHRSQDPRVVIIEYDVHGKILATGVAPPSKPDIILTRLISLATSPMFSRQQVQVKKPQTLPNPP